ncbi:hypothetical protein [Pseudomonas sp. SDO5271_S396]
MEMNMFNQTIVAEIPFDTAVQSARKDHSVNLNHLKESLAYGLNFNTCAAHKAHFDRLAEAVSGAGKIAKFSTSRTKQRLAEFEYPEATCDLIAKAAANAYDAALAEQFYFVPFRPDPGPYHPNRMDAFDRTRVWLHGGSRDEIRNQDALAALSDESISAEALEWLSVKVQTFAFPTILDRRNYQGGFIIRLKDLNLQNYPLPGWIKLSRDEILEYGSSADTFLNAPLK